MLNWASFWGALGRKFSHRPRVARWPSAGDIAGYSLRRPKLTPVYLTSMVLQPGGLPPACIIAVLEKEAGSVDGPRTSAITALPG